MSPLTRVMFKRKIVIAVLDSRFCFRIIKKVLTLSKIATTKIIPKEDA